MEKKNTENEKRRQMIENAKKEENRSRGDNLRKKEFTENPCVCIKVEGQRSKK